MFTKLAVPLDGSPLAEKALSYAVRLANLFNARLLLLRVAEERPNPIWVQEMVDHELLLTEKPEKYVELLRVATLFPAFDVKEALEKYPPQAVEVYSDVEDEDEAYLQEVEATITNPVVDPHLPADRVETTVVYGKAAHQIAEVAAEKGADLLVMTTHGRNGLSLLVTGSVAAHVIQHSLIPVVLVRPVELEEAAEQGIPAEPLSFGRRVGPVILTLDGTPEAEHALKPAVELARQLEVPLHVLEVISPIVPIPAGEFGAMIYDEYGTADETRLLRERATAYLDGIQAMLEDEGVKCHKAIRVGDPATEIVEYARAMEASLLVTATHARSRLGKLILGSVAEEVMRQSHLPVMMVRIPLHASSKHPAVPLPVGR